MFTCRCFNISILHIHIQKQILCKFPLYINVELVTQHKHIKYEKYENGVYHTITNFYSTTLYVVIVYRYTTIFTASFVTYHLSRCVRTLN